MCLYIDKKSHYGLTPLVSEFDIDCYKILYKKRNRLRTPFMDVIVNVNERFIAKVNGNKELNFDEIETNFIDAIDGGSIVKYGIHTYSCIKAVNMSIMFLKQNDADKYRKYEVYHCVIPKGTKYYIGMGNDYCSECIDFVEKIEL